MSQQIHLARLPRFQVPGESGSKVILLRKSTKNYQNLTSYLVSKSRVSSTQLSGQVNLHKKSSIREYMRSTTCVYLNVTLTYDVFSVVRETVSDFSKNLPQFSFAFNQLSLLINPARALLNKTECFLTFFCTKCILDCFSGPFGPSETIYPKNSFPTTHNVDTLELQNQISCSATAPT